MECGESNIAPIWKIDLAELKISLLSLEFHVNYQFYSQSGDYKTPNGDYKIVNGEVRNVIYETEDNSMKLIQNAALYILALNCGIIAYWFAQYKPIFNDFQTNHGAKNENGERNGQPRPRINLFGFKKIIGLNRFITLVSFLSKIWIPFIDSITGKSNRHSVQNKRTVKFEINGQFVDFPKTTNRHYLFFGFGSFSK